MTNEILKTRVGRTPLIRSKVLEKELGISEIYLKLEGNNPSGHREDRLAYLIIRDALSRGKNIICMGTYGTTGSSLSYLSEFFDIECIFYVPDKKKVLRKEMLSSPNVKIVEFGNTYEDCVYESKRVAEKNGWYDANPGLDNNIMNMYAYSYIAKEIQKQAKKNITTVFSETCNGSSISGLHLGFRSLWVHEEIDNIPKIYAATTSQGNAIFESFKNEYKTLEITEPSSVKETRFNRYIVNTEPFNGQDALNSIYDSGGKAIGVNDEELQAYYERFKEISNIRIGISNFFPVAALFKEAKQGKLSNGVHILVLNDGQIDLDIRQIEKDELPINYSEFLKKLDEWLVQFSDPEDEMDEAVENAFEHGFVLNAYHNNQLVGIAIISKTRFSTFFPKYHLSYIATKKDVKGKGIATQLIEEIISITGGDISLHVETDNPRAIKLYEKMGFEKKYYRMLYKGGES